MSVSQGSETPRHTSSGARWLLLAALIVVLDQATKIVALATLVPYEPVAVTGFLNFTLGFNPGAAFSFLTNAGGWQRWLFISLGLGISVVLTIWLCSARPRPKLGSAGIALLMGGALGNVYDRILRDGKVVDFLDFHLFGRHWPVFNLADTAICVGVALIIIFGAANRDSRDAQQHKG